jgi:hypothetical protein
MCFRLCMLASGRVSITAQSPKRFTSSSRDNATSMGRSASSDYAETDLRQATRESHRLFNHCNLSDQQLLIALHGAR